MTENTLKSNLSPERQKAATIIDIIEGRLTELYPFIKELQESFEANALFRDEEYYRLEDELTALIGSKEEKESKKYCTHCNDRGYRIINGQIINCTHCSPKEP